MHQRVYPTLHHLRTAGAVGGGGIGCCGVEGVVPDGGGCLGVWWCVVVSGVIGGGKTSHDGGDVVFDGVKNGGAFVTGNILEKQLVEGRKVLLRSLCGRLEMTALRRLTIG